MPRDYDRRSRPTTVRLELAIEIFLFLWGNAYGEVETSEVLAAIASEHANDEVNRKNLSDLLQRKAQIHGLDFGSYVAALIRNSGKYDFLKVEEIDWQVFLKGLEAMEGEASDD